MIVRLSASVMVQHRKSTTVCQLSPVKHHPFRTETSLHPQLLMLPFHGIDDIATKEHFHLSEAILKKLRLLNLHLVPKEVHQQVIHRLEEFHVVQMDHISVHPIRKQMIADGTRTTEKRIVQNLEELGRMSLFGPI